MTTKQKTKFYEFYGLKPTTEFTLEQLAQITSIPYEGLKMVYDRGNVIESALPPSFSFHKKRVVKPKHKGMTRVWKVLVKAKGWDADKDVIDYYNFQGILDSIITIPNKGDSEAVG